MASIVICKPEIRWEMKKEKLLSLSTGIHLSSPFFYTRDKDSKDVVKWKLKLYPNGLNSSYKDYIGIFLHNYNSKSFKVSCRLSVLHEEVVLKTMYTVNKTIPKDYGLGYPAFMLKAGTLNEQLENNKLVILCNIIIE